MLHDKNSINKDKTHFLADFEINKLVEIKTIKNRSKIYIVIYNE